MKPLTVLAKDIRAKIGAPLECKTCLFDESIAKIHDDGECEMCKLQTQLRNQAREPWDNVLQRIKRKGRGKQFDCLIGISGGGRFKRYALSGREGLGIAPARYSLQQPHEQTRSN